MCKRAYEGLSRTRTEAVVDITGFFALLNSLEHERSDIAATNRVTKTFTCKQCYQLWDLIYSVLRNFRGVVINTLKCHFKVLQ